MSAGGAVPVYVLRAVAGLVPGGRVEYPGCVVVPVPAARASWWFGTANGPWQGDLTPWDGSPVVRTVDLGLGSDAAAGDVAVAILRAVEGVSDGVD